MSSLLLAAVGHDGSMDSPGPRADQPTPRKSYTHAQKLDYLDQHEQAILRREGGAYLRSNGLYSSQMTEWRRLRDAGVLEGKNPGLKVGKPSHEQAEIERLRRQLEVSESRLKKTEAALDVMGKLAGLLESLSEPTSPEPSSKKR